MLGTNVSAAVTSNGGSSNIDATTGVENPTISVTVPTSLNFVIDPYETDSKGQIYSDDAIITNASDVAVKVDVKVTPTLGGGVNLVAKGDVNTTDTADTDKDIYLALKTAKAADSTPAVTDWADESTYSVVKTTGTTVSVKLDKAGGTLLTTGLGVTGAANPIAAWATGDVTVNFAFTVTGLTPAMDDAITTVTDTLGLIQVGPSVAVTQSTVKSGQDGVYVLNNIGSATISKIVWEDVWADDPNAIDPDFVFPPAQYTFANGTLTVPATSEAAGFMCNSTNNKLGTYNMVITLSDNTVLNTTITFE